MRPNFNCSYLQWNFWIVLEKRIYYRLIEKSFTFPQKKKKPVFLKAKNLLLAFV